MFAKIIDNIVEKYPYNPAEDYPVTGFPEGSDYPEFNIYWVHKSPLPQFFPLDQNIVESDPQYIDGQWVKSWSVEEKTLEEKRIARYNPAKFLEEIHLLSSYQAWMTELNSNLYSTFLLAVERATNSGNWVYAQNLYNVLKVQSPHGHATQWQAIAVQYGIPMEL
jgi:hypothetical protein